MIFNKLLADEEALRARNFAVSLHPTYELHILCGDVTNLERAASRVHIMAWPTPRAWLSEIMEQSRAYEHHFCIRVQTRKTGLNGGEVICGSPPLRRFLREAAPGLSAECPPDAGLYRRVQNLQESSGLRRVLNFLELLLVLTETCEQIETNQIGSICEARSAMEPAVQETIEMLMQHPNGDPQISDVAKSRRMNVATLSKKFHRAVGMSFSEFKSHLRVEKAMALLYETDLRIEDIAHRCGFGDASALNRNFRKIRGMSPTNFRNALRESTEQMEASLPGRRYQIMPCQDSVTVTALK